MDNLDTMPEKEKQEAALNEQMEKQGIETVKAEDAAPTSAPTEKDEAINFSSVSETDDVDAFDEDEDLPTLYSERVIYTFSVLFSVIAGGILLARNLKEVNRKDGIPHVIAFSIIYTMLSGYLMNVTKIGPVGTVVLAIVGSMVLNSYFWKAYIGTSIAYHRKRYGKALVIALLILVPLFFFAMWGASTAEPIPTEGLRID